MNSERQCSTNSPSSDTPTALPSMALTKQCILDSGDGDTLVGDAASKTSKMQNDMKSDDNGESRFELAAADLKRRLSLDSSGNDESSDKTASIDLKSKSTQSATNLRMEDPKSPLFMTLRRQSSLDSSDIGQLSAGGQLSPVASKRQCSASSLESGKLVQDFPHVASRRQRTSDLFSRGKLDEERRPGNQTRKGARNDYLSRSCLSFFDKFAQESSLADEIWSTRPSRTVSGDSRKSPGSSTPKLDSSSLSSAGELLESWPETRRRPRSPRPRPPSTIEWSFKQQETNKRVRFSESARLYTYSFEPSSNQINSYSKADRKSFTHGALTEAVRIKRLLATTAQDSDCTMADRLKKCGIAHEEILGIEHLALERSATRIIKERRYHVKAILFEQERQRASGEENSDKLAQVSKIFTEKSVTHAKKRANFAV